MATLKDNWMQYSAFAVPKDASLAQQAAMRNSFYAGSLAVMKVLTACPDSSEEEILNTLCAELNARVVRVLTEAANGEPV